MSWTLPSWIWEGWWGRSPGRWNKQHWLWRDGRTCQRWYRHWRALWFYQWNWAWTLYAGRGTTNQQRHCCTHCWSRCEAPWGCFGCSNALPQDIEHFPGLQQQRLLALHFWTNSECSTVGYCLGRLSRRQLEGRHMKQKGPRSTS